MYFKNALILLLFFIPFKSFSQIKVSDVNDWKQKVDSAIMLIKEVDSVKYKILIDNCEYVDYIVGDFSTTQPPHTIVINVKDIKLNSINNLACVLVHESYHLYLYNSRIKLSTRKEELVCYEWEYDFICKLPSVENWIFNNVIRQIIYYSN